MKASTQRGEKNCSPRVAGAGVGPWPLLVELAAVLVLVVVVLGGTTGVGRSNVDEQVLP